MKIIDEADADARRSVRDFCHDARQPIATIGMLVGCVRSSVLDPGVARQLDQISGQLAELRDMAERVLLDEARPRWFDVARELTDLVEGFRLLHAGEVRVVAERGALMHGDALAVRRVLRNLLENASRARPDGRIDLLLRHRRDRCEVSICDQGAALASVGTGLGLGIVGRLALQAGAQVTVARSPSGTVATLVLRRSRHVDGLRKV